MIITKKLLMKIEKKKKKKRKNAYLDEMSSKTDHLGRPQNLIPKNLSDSCNLVRNGHGKCCIWLIRNIHNN